MGYNPSYPFIRLFIGVITPFITTRGLPCRIRESSQKTLYIEVLNCSNWPRMVVQLRCQVGFVGVKYLLVGCTRFFVATLECA